MVLGETEGHCVPALYTFRGEAIRVITARDANNW